MTSRGIFPGTNQNSVNGFHSFAPCETVSVKLPNFQDEGGFSVPFERQVSRADCPSVSLRFLQRTLGDVWVRLGAYSAEEDSAVLATQMELGWLLLPFVFHQSAGGELVYFFTGENSKMLNLPSWFLSFRLNWFSAGVRLSFGRGFMNSFSETDPSPFLS